MKGYRNEKAKIPFRWVCHHGGLVVNPWTHIVEWRSAQPTLWSEPMRPFRGVAFRDAQQYARRPWLV